MLPKVANDFKKYSISSNNFFFKTKMGRRGKGHDGREVGDPVATGPLK